MMKELSAASMETETRRVSISINSNSTQPLCYLVIEGL